MSAWRRRRDESSTPLSFTDLTSAFSFDWFRATTVKTAGLYGAPIRSVARRTSGEPITYSPLTGSSG